MSEEPEIRHPVVRIDAKIEVGDHLMAATDDPVFLGVRGPGGREFRLALARGHALRRGREEHFVLAAADDPATNVAHPELNDPTRPALDAEAITGFYLRKGVEPIPNVRGVGEMDDRLEVVAVEIEVTAEGQPKSLRFARRGPIWLGLLCGVFLEIPSADTSA